MNETGLYLDFLFLRGTQGGFENSLNRVATYCSGQGVHVRFVQMAPSGIDWAVKEAVFACLEVDQYHFTFDVARTNYANLLKSDKRKPDLILAAGWPNATYVAKGAITDAGLSIPVAAWPHGDERYYADTSAGDFEVYRYADACFALNDTIAKDIRERFPDKPVYRVNNVYDDMNICYSEDRNTYKLAYVGRLSTEKVIETILGALALTTHPWELMIVGDGPSMKTLQELASGLQIAHLLHFLGWKESPWEEVTRCRALVVSSLYEAAPLNVLEALASGMQVLSTPVGFIPELIENGKNGYIWDFGDPNALAAAINRLDESAFTPETARLCRDSVILYRPENALAGFLKSIEAVATRSFSEEV